mmetsp:Transcript_19227/g.32393  ORF Transcript_19227/g.32393 Transcript_19227/m.32393 type:complete len:294 (-) Transcript_19227:496-1377(-)
MTYQQRAHMSHVKEGAIKPFHWEVAHLLARNSEHGMWFTKGLDVKAERGQMCRAEAATTGQGPSTIDHPDVKGASPEAGHLALARATAIGPDQLSVVGHQEADLHLVVIHGPQGQGQQLGVRRRLQAPVVHWHVSKDMILIFSEAFSDGLQIPTASKAMSHHSCHLRRADPVLGILNDVLQHCAGTRHRGCAGCQKCMAVTALMELVGCLEEELAEQEDRVVELWIAGIQKVHIHRCGESGCIRIFHFSSQDVLQGGARAESNALSSCFGPGVLAPCIEVFGQLDAIQPLVLR